MVRRKQHAVFGENWHGVCDVIYKAKRNGKIKQEGLTMETLKRFMVEEEGQGLVEYALIIGLIAVVAIAALTASGGSIASMFDTISSKLSAANSSVSTS